MINIPIKGVIVSNDDKWIYDWFEMESTSPKDVSNLLNSSPNEEVTVDINSGGGDVYAGSEIYTLLMNHQANVTANIVGLAASAASVIAMGANKTRISPTAQIMIHNVSTRVSGDYRDLQHEADVLKNYNVSISNAYQLKTGIDQQELLELMNDTTWMNAQTALDKGFVDEIMFDNTLKLSASSFDNSMLSQHVIDKMRNFLKDQKTNQEKEQHELQNKQMQAKLNLLKLGGNNA